MKKEIQWSKSTYEYQIFKKGKWIKRSKLYFLLILVILVFGTSNSNAQNIVDDGIEQYIGLTGSYQDFIIPNNSSIIKIRFTLSGADGGAAHLRLGQIIPVPFGDDIFLEAYSYLTGGGNGAVLNGTFLVGTGPGKIPLGSTIRFIIGEKGESGSDNISVLPDGGTGSEYGGGGGGTAVLYRAPGMSTWTLLGVAGGGGGAYQGVISGVALGLGDNGGAGEESNNGADGHGTDGGTGGNNGNGGGRSVGIVGISPIAAGGGGRFSNGSGLLTYVDILDITLDEHELKEKEFGEGGAGQPGGFENGGYGGNGELQPEDFFILDFRTGGYGYGGGGMAVGTGAGGGGYSGGGAGGLFNGGGGGGSYLNGIRESGNISSGGSDESPDEGFANYQVILNQPPVALCKNISIYLDESGNASITADDVNNGSSDPEGLALELSISKSDFTCADIGDNTVTLTVKDNYGSETTCIATVTVIDNTPPVIDAVNPDISSLWPPNHKMKEINVSIENTDNCSAVCKIINVTSNEPDNGLGDGDTGPDYEITGDTKVNLRSERSALGTGRIYTIQVECTDASNNKSYSETTVSVVHNITSPGSGSPFKIGSTVNFEGVFWDKPGNIHSASWLIDNITTTGIVAEPTGLKNGKVTGSYKFSNAGVYKLKMNLKDQDGIISYANTNGDVDAIVVIYDPNGGNAYGGGWFASPKGALKADPDATGKVSFGFASSYFKKATTPKGETQMEFKIGSLEFNALNFEYLVINNARAQFKGTGKINGDKAGYGFIMTVTDGRIDGSGTDKIRLKIFNKITGEVIYDNQPGASDADDPQTTVGDGSDIVIITATKQGVREDLDYITEANGTFSIKLFPNPTQSSFNLLVNSLDKTDVQVKVFNSTGQLVKSIKGIAGQTTSFGNELKSGMYFIEVVQGVNKRTVKLIKF